MKTFWDKIAPLYDFSESLNKKVYDKMLGYSHYLVPQGAKVLECAAGTGEISIAVSDKASEITCTDLSIKMLEQAEKKCRAKGITNITFEERNIFDLKDPDETYDAVIAANVLHLLDEPQKAIYELLRVLKPHGKLIVPTFITIKSGSRPMTMIRLYKLLGFAPKADYCADSYYEMLRTSIGKSGVSARLRMRVIGGLVPNAYAVIEKR